jgi:anti-anti-sigma factor
MMTMTASDRAAFRDFAARSGVVVFVDGELDLETAPGLRPALAEMIARYPEVVLDLSGLEFCDCYGLGVLLGARTAPVSCSPARCRRARHACWR